MLAQLGEFPTRKSGDCSSPFYKGPTRGARSARRIPHTEVWGLFKSFLKEEPSQGRIPQTAVCGLFKSVLQLATRLELAKPIKNCTHHEEAKLNCESLDLN